MPKNSSGRQQPIASGLQDVHDGVVGRVEQDHDSVARDGMCDLEDHVRLGARGTPQYGGGVAAGSQVVECRLIEIAAVERTKYR